MDLASVEGLSFSYAGARAPALRDVFLAVGPGESIALVGPSGSGKSTLVRALAGLVPHFHGGRFEGRVVVGGLDTRCARPSALAGAVATVFQDPEDQIVMSTVWNEVAFGLENVGTPPRRIAAAVEDALAAVGALHLVQRRTAELSGGELQRVCLAAALALRPQLLLLDEPMSQLDPEGAAAFVGAVARSGAAVVVSEHRVARAFSLAARVAFLDGGRLVRDAPKEEASAWFAARRPAFLPETGPVDLPAAELGEPVLEIEDVAFRYDRAPVLDGTSLTVRAGEVVVLGGPNGAGKSTLAKIAAGLLAPAAGRARRRGLACYLPQDPGRHLVSERVDDEVALGVAGDRERALRALGRVGLEGVASRHPRDLSSGERERLGLAAVAAPEPRLLILDEPTRGVDPERRLALGAWLADYAAAGNAVLVVTHDASFPAHRRVALGQPVAVPVARPRPAAVGAAR